MSTTARVESIDAIKDFRVHLTKFQEMAGRALGDADSDVHRTVRWLEGEGLNFWTSAIRKRQEQLAKAEEAFRFKRLYKDSSGATPSAVEEQKAVQLAKKRLEEAQTKLANVKKWTRQLQKAISDYRGGVGAFSNAVSGGVPQAVAYLGALLDELDKYLEVTAAREEEGALAGAGAGGVGREETGASMARAAEEAVKPKEGVDPAALRAGVPSSQALFGAHPAEKGPVQLACGPVTAAQQSEAAKFAGAAVPTDGERIVNSAAIAGSSRVYLVRLDTAGLAWYLGSVDEADTGVYNTVSVGDLRGGRPDVADLLRLPVGYIAVIGPGGVEAIYNGQNESVFQAG
ncbi:MAG: hypothetical protein ABSB42_14795 [Tepidisphaeraceae bacterium]|jgi:hypothetical protein